MFHAAPYLRFLLPRSSTTLVLITLFVRIALIILHQQPPMLVTYNNKIYFPLTQNVVSLQATLQ